jgi:hypothetical protein
MKPKPTSAPIWAYVYRIEPPLTEDRLAGVKQLLDREHASATCEARTFEGRFVAEEHVTHILVVSDSVDQSRAINRELEAELQKVAISVDVTVPLAVVPDASHQGTAPPTDQPPPDVLPPA